MGRETVIVGVFQGYEKTGSGLVQVQTAKGTRTADLGPVKFLTANHIALNAGDTIRLTGVSSTTRQGTVFLARVIQKGGDILLLRSAQGAPLGRYGTARLGAQQQRAESAR